MVVHDFNVVSITVAPREADAPLVVDPNAVGPGPVAFQHLQLVPRWHSQILQPLGPMQEEKLAARNALERLEPPDGAILKKRDRVGVLERPDQVTVYDALGIMSNVIGA